MTSESPASLTVEEASIATQLKKPTPKHVFEGHERTIWSIVFLHDNVHVVSGSEDGTMRKWNCDTGLLVGEPWKGEGGAVYALALAPDGKRIACGRDDGSVQRWNTDGEMIAGVWTGHSKWVRSLSWSPSGSHIASGSDDETILIRKAESGQGEVISIKTNQTWVRSLAYSPDGKRIASGGWNRTICIWDSKTGKLVVEPIHGLGNTVDSLVWSPDGTKLCSSSDNFARVFDSASGAELHRFGHATFLYSVALSPAGNVLACVGNGGVAQLWDTETHEELGQPFGQGNTLHDVTFSRDQEYLAYGGLDKKITLWIANEIAHGLAMDASTTIEDGAPEEEETRPAEEETRPAEEETRPESSSSSYLDLDAKNPRARPGDDEGEGSGDRYKNFFRSSKTSLALASPDSDSRPFHRRFWTFVIASRHRPPEEKSFPPKEKHHKRSLFRRRARSKSPLQVPATTDYSKGKVQEGENVEETRNDVNYPTNSPPDAHKKKIKGKGKGREDSVTDARTPPPDDSSPPAEEHDDQSDFLSSAPSGPSRRHAPGNESIPLTERPKRSFFGRYSGPRPVTIYAARPKKWYYTARGKKRNTDKKNGKTSSAAVQPTPAAQPHSAVQSQQQYQAEAQAAIQPAGALEEYDDGRWENFRFQVALALCCIPRRPPVTSAGS